MSSPALNIGAAHVHRRRTASVNYRVAYYLPSQMMTNFPKLRDFTVPDGADVQGRNVMI